MLDLNRLEAQSPLGGYEQAFATVKLTEISDMALVSIAAPLNGALELHKQFASAFGAAWPKPTKSSIADDGRLRLWGLQSDMVFASFMRSSDNAVSDFTAQLAGLAYCTDQSDAWAVLQISGTGAVRALERICPLDLHLNSMPIGTATRTVMDHLGVIIARESDLSFLLLSASSSAVSFLRAVELSIKNTE